MSAKKKIVTCFPLAETHVEQIRSVAGAEFEVVASTQEDIPVNLIEADIFCGHAKVPVDWKAVVAANRLSWIQSSAAGLDHCLTPEVIESDILVSGCSGLFAPQVAEQTISLLSGLIRRAPVFFRAQQNKEYVRRPTDDLFGKTIGIIGFGGNGQRIAQVLRPMVKSILATDCFPDACEKLVANGTVKQVLPNDGLEHLLKESDVVIVTLPLSDANEQLIGDEQFQLFKEGAYLINVGRGSVVQTDAMIKNLSNGRLAGVGVDVVDPEPLPANSPLWDFENVMISPHVGAQSPRRIPVTVDLFCDNLDRYRAGESLLNLVDKVLGFPRPENRIKLEWGNL
jgi:D-3-phosphoglycerate dehydrogenase